MEEDDSAFQEHPMHQDQPLTYTLPDASPDISNRPDQPVTPIHPYAPRDSTTVLSQPQTGFTIPGGTFEHSRLWCNQEHLDSEIYVDETS